MKKASRGRAGRQPMVDKQREFVRLIRRGVSISEACRRLEIDRKTGHWWKNGGVVTRNGVIRVVEPIMNRFADRSPPSPRYLSLDERIVIADGLRAGRSARAIAEELGRAVSTVAREIKRNSDPNGEYRPHRAHHRMLERRPRPKPRKVETDAGLRRLIQQYLDKHWSPEQISHHLRAEHGLSIAVETIYQALYSPTKPLHRDPKVTLRTKRPHRRPRRRGDERRPRFIAPIQLITDRPAEAEDRSVPGHWEGDLIVGSYNRSAIGTLAERTTRYTLLVHIGSDSRAESLRDGLIEIFQRLPSPLRRSLTWDQGAEIALHNQITQAAELPIYLCHPGSPWERPTNENTNRLLRDYFPKGTDLAVHSPTHLLSVAEELNQRPRRTLNWQTPEQLFAILCSTAV